MGLALQKTIETLVVGADPAGLTAAYELAKQGRDVLVLESDPDYVGGLSRTVNYKGFLLDIGGHRFASKSQEIVALWHEILPQGLIERPNRSRLYFHNRVFDAPLNARAIFDALGPVESARCLLSYLKARALPHAKTGSFHDLARNRYGDRLFELFFKPYAEKLWGLPCEEISAATLDEAGEAAGSFDRFRYPRFGPGMMWEAAREKIEERGGEVHLGAKVESLQWSAASGEWSVDVLQADGFRESYRAKHIVASAPVRELIRSISPTPMSVFHARSLHHRDLISVVLIGRAKAGEDETTLAIHDASVKAARVQNFANWSPDLIPDGTSFSLSLDYYCSAGDALWTSDDKDLIALAAAEAEKLGLMRLETLADGCVLRQTNARPIRDTRAAQNIETVRQDMETNFPTFHLVGRDGLHKDSRQDHAMMTGLLTARNIMAGERLYDVSKVDDDAGYAKARVSMVGNAPSQARSAPRRVA